MIESLTHPGTVYVVWSRWAKLGLFVFEGIPLGLIRVRPYIRRNSCTIATAQDLRQMDAAQGYIP